MALFSISRADPDAHPMPTAYDDNGNRTTANGAAYATETGNRMTTDGTYRYEYDDNGNRMLRYKDVDSSETLNTGDTDITTYAWDYRNRLVTASDQATFGAAVAASVEYIYDAFNNRISKIVDADGDGTAESPVRTNFALLDGEVYLEFNGTTLTHRYMPGPSIDMNLAIEEMHSDGTTHGVLWALTDHQGTVRDVIDSTGAVTNHIQYNSFGHITSQTHGHVNYRFTYTGRELDAETGLYYYRARYYDAENGKFISEDPIAFQAGDANLYRYVGNNPMNQTDPMGLDAVSPGDKLWDDWVREQHAREAAAWKPLFTADSHSENWESKSKVTDANHVKAKVIPGKTPAIQAVGGEEGYGAVFLKRAKGPGKNPKCCIEIEFEFNHVKGGNSGLHIGIPDVPNGETYDWRKHVVGPGYEIQLQSNARDAEELQGAIDDENTAKGHMATAKRHGEEGNEKKRKLFEGYAKRSQQRANKHRSSITGSIYGIAPSNGKVKVKDGWNKMRVRMCHLGNDKKTKESKGMKIKVFMESNGKWVLLTSFNRQAPDHKDLEILDRGANDPKTEPKRSHGDIAIQGHGPDDITSFRNIRWREPRDACNKGGGQ